MPKMTREDASRIQSATCKATNGAVKAGSFAARAMSAAFKNEPISKPVSNYTGAPQVLIKIGIFAVAAAAAYYKSDAIVDCASSFFRHS